MANPRIDLTGKIPGWGSDLDLSRRPGVPREHLLKDEKNLALEQITQQPRTTKIFVTIERPAITPIFGTTCPPKGLSGVMKSKAYTYGEGKLRRWLMLYGSDRVDVVESAITDLFAGKKALISVPILAGVIGGAAYLLKRRSASKPRSRATEEAEVTLTAGAIVGRPLNDYGSPLAT